MRLGLVLLLTGLGLRPVQAQALTPVDSAAVEVMLDSLSLRDRIAQLVMPWIPGNYVAFDDSAFARLQGWVDSLHVGGIIVSNGGPLDVAAKLNRLQVRSPLPLLVGADLESGTSFRLQGGTPFPSNMGVGATGREEDAYEIGRVTALEGRAVGIHVAFAPVADVNNNPANPIINTRSFGEDPWAVARLVAAAVRGIQDNGMLATAKHFPGHGDTGIDSHIAIPVIRSVWSRLDTLELVPFRAAIAAGVALVMSSHVALPQLTGDSSRPATLSASVLTGVLRDSLHFQGFTVTDALGMGAIVNTYGGGEAAVMAFEAGADILLQPADPRAAIDAMEIAVNSGRIGPERLTAAVRRMLTLKLRLGLFHRRSVSLDSVPEVVGSSRFLTSARDIAQRAVVLVSDSLGTVDSLRAHWRSVTVVSYGEENSPNVGIQFVAALRALGYPVGTFRLWSASGEASYDSVRALLRRKIPVVFVAAVRATAGKGTLGLPDALADLIDETARRRHTVLISLGSPYIVTQTPHVSSYLLGWSSNPITEWAVAQALGGTAAISGRLPIRLPPHFPLGFGLQRALTGPPATETR